MRNEKAPKILLLIDVMVCIVSIGIGLFCGMVYNSIGSAVAAVIGLLVAINWCCLMRLILCRYRWHFFFVFVSAVILGGMAGMIDGASLHLICHTGMSRNIFIPSNLMRAVDIGLKSGLAFGLINGALWGCCYSVLAFQENRIAREAVGNV